MNKSNIKNGYENDMGRNMQGSCPFIRCTTIKVVATVAAVILPLLGYADTTPGLFSKLLRSNMNGIAVKVIELPEQDKRALVRGLDFSPDGSRLAIDTENASVNIWDWRKKQVEKVLQKPELGNDFGVINPLLYSPDGKRLLNCLQSSTGTAAVRVWDVVAGTMAKDLTEKLGTQNPGECRGMVFTPGGNVFVRTANTWGKPGNNLIAFRIDTLEPVWGISIDSEFSPDSVAASPNGNLLAVSGSVSHWKAGEITSVLSIYIIGVQDQKISKVITTEAVGPLAWSPDGKRIAVAGGIGGIEIFDAASGKKLASERIENAGRMNIRFTSDGRYFILSDLNGNGKGLGVKIWDSQIKTLFQVIPGDIASIAVSRDSKYLAVGEAGRTTIWQLN